MKIAILAHLKYPIAQPFSGGLEMHTHLLTEGLARRGHDVTLFAARGSNLRCRLEAVCDPTGEGHGDRELERKVANREDAAYRSMMHLVTDAGFDVIHNNSLHTLPLKAARTIGCPMITALHTPPFEPLADAVRSAGDEMPFVAVSNNLAEHWSGLASNIGVISNGIDLAAFRARPWPREPVHAIWSGRIVPEKGLHLAIDAARIAGLPLAFAGPRNDTDYWSEEIVPRLGGGLVDLGHLAHADLARRIAAASVAVVSPRWDEPFGLVVAEALACGTPVAAFARGAIPSLVDRTCGALAQPDNAHDLARAILDAMACDRARCRAHAERYFDAERMIDGYETLYARRTTSLARRNTAICNDRSEDLAESTA